MIFRNVTFSDNGKYMCNVSNPFGWTTEEGFLRIKSPTAVKGNMNDTKIELGENATLVCNVSHDSDVNLNIKWLRGKKHITEDKEFYSTISIKRVSVSKYQTEETLTIYNATKKHSGKYTCLAETEVDYAETVSNVKVKLKENYVVVYISVSICLLTSIVAYLTYPYCITKNK